MLLINAEAVRLGFPAHRKQPERVLIEKFDWQLRVKERVGLTGRSGLGKSTLIGAILNRALNRSTETVRAGRLVVASGPIGFVSQRPDTPPWFSVGALLDGFSQRAREERVAALRAMATHLGLDPLRGAHPRTLSGGELQRVKLMIALSLAGDLLVLDEPLSALDLATKMELLAVVSDYLDKYGIALLLVSHDMDVLLHLSQVVHVIEPAGIVASIPGKLCADGGLAGSEALLLRSRDSLVRAMSGQKG